MTADEDEFDLDEFEARIVESFKKDLLEILRDDEANSYDAEDKDELVRVIFSLKDELIAWLTEELKPDKEC